jgi:hypothetical protein
MTTAAFDVGTGAAMLDLPPLFSEIALRELGDAFAHARDIAATRGAGTLVWVRRFDVAEFAVVLEPDEPLAAARRALYVGLAAMGDALASYVPPEKPVTFDWPDQIRLDGAIVGGGRIAWPHGTAETEVPAWMVFGGMLRTVVLGETESGFFKLGSALELEGVAAPEPKILIESFARHLMLHVDAIGERGFKKVGEQWLARLPRETGVRRAIDGNGDLLVRRAGVTGAAERSPLLSRLASPPQWLDPETGMPWL